MQPVTNSPPWLAALYISWQIRLDMIIILFNNRCLYALHGLLNLHLASGKDDSTCTKINSTHDFANMYKSISWNNSRDQKLEFDWQHMFLSLRTIAKYFSHQSKSQQKQYSFNLTQHARDVGILKKFSHNASINSGNMKGFWRYSLLKSYIVSFLIYNKKTSSTKVYDQGANR